MGGKGRKGVMADRDPMDKMAKKDKGVTVVYKDQWVE